MNNSIRTLQLTILVVAGILLAGCGGTKVLKQPMPLQATQSLVTASDRQLVATLDWVIVRDGPGTWARNADWDQYLLRVRNESRNPVTIDSVHVVDALDFRIDPETERKRLVKASKKTAKRYRGNGVRVKAGAGTGTMLATGAAVTAVGVGVAYGAASAAVMSGGTAAAGGAVAAASALTLIGPALVVGGVVRGVNNSKVNGEIELQQTNFPFEAAPGTERSVTVFFPLAPSPRQVVLTYTDATGTHELALETTAALDGLHLTD
jgi:hypothetical protein